MFCIRITLYRLHLHFNDIYFDIFMHIIVESQRDTMQAFDLLLRFY